MPRNKRTYIGIWWLPSNQNQKIFGTLQIDEAGDASFFTIQKLLNEGKINNWSKVDALFGIATSLEEQNDCSIKLYDLHKIKHAEGVLSKSIYSASKALIGAPNLKENGFLFNTMMLFSQTWNWWININGLKIKPKKAKLKYGIFSDYTQPDIIKLYKDERFFIYIYFRGNYGASVEHGFNILEQPFLNLEINDSIDIKEAVKLKTDIERYFMIIWKARHLFNVFELRSNDDTQFQVVEKDYTKLNTNIHGRDSFGVYKRTSQKTLDKWFKISKELENLLDTFFFAYTSKDLDVNSKFLQYVFSLELYHRIRVKDRRSLSIKDERMTNQVLNELKGDSKSWINNVLSKDRDIPFDNRLTELIEINGDDEMIKLPQSTIKKIKKTRHYLVHLDSKYKNDSLTTQELLEVNGMLTLLFLSLLKKELKTKHINTRRKA